MIKFSKVQTGLWGLMAAVIGLSAESTVNDIKSSFIVFAMFIFFATMAVLNYLFCEALEENFI